MESSACTKTMESLTWQEVKEYVLNSDRFKVVSNLAGKYGILSLDRNKGALNLAGNNGVRPDIIELGLKQSSPDFLEEETKKTEFITNWSPLSVMRLFSF